MRIVVVGAGPIGGNIGGRLARQGKDVTFIDVDPDHVQAIRKNGLQVDVPDGNFNIPVRILFPNEIDGKFDTAFIAVRTNYTGNAVNSIVPYLAENGLLVSLQNGINLPLLEQAVGPDRAIGAALRLRSVRLAPGHIRTSWRGHLHIGHTHGRTTRQLETVHSLLSPVIPTEITDNILGVLWSKLTYTCFGLFGSLADSGWELCMNIRKSRSVGFTFAWYRLTLELPEQVNGIAIAGTRVFFETNIDNYGEIWVDGKQDRVTGMIQGNNAQQRVEASTSAVPGNKHVIACLAANGPLGEPRGGVFLRYATLAFESRD